MILLLMTPKFPMSVLKASEWTDSDMDYDNDINIENIFTTTRS